MTELEQPLTRRRALQWAGGVGIAAFVAACANEGGSGSASPAASTASTASTADTTTETTGGAAATPDCVLMPELTEGPYYLDLDLVRSDVAEGRSGLPFDLQVAVVDADACEPIEGAAVDIWHCDAEGAYSRRPGRRERDVLPRRPADERRRGRRVPHGLPRLVHRAGRAHPPEGAGGRRSDAHGPALLRPGHAVRRLRRGAVRGPGRAGPAERERRHLRPKAAA